MKFNLTDAIPFLVLGGAAIHHFGIFEGLGVVAAIYLLAPYYVVGNADVGKGNVR